MNQLSFLPSSARWLAAVVAAGVGALHFANAAESPPANTNAPSVALDTLVADVLEHNPELNFYRAEIAAAKGERRTAEKWANPEVSTTVGQKQVRGGGLLDEGVAWSVSVWQTFEWPGRIPLRKAIANHQIKLAGLGFDQFRSALVARARTLAFNLFAAHEKAAAAQEVAERFQALREVLVQRDAAGLTPLLERRIIEATELTLQRKASEAALEAQAAMLELNQLRGQPWTNALKVESAQLSFPSVPDVDVLLSATQTNNFELQMRQAELEQQGFRVSLAKNEKNPAVTVGPYLAQERAGDRETQVGIGLSLPLPLWNRNTGKIATEEARQQQAATSLLVTQRSIERQVVERARAYQTKIAEMAKWRPDSVPQFKEAAALADRHYRVGAVPIATYVELQKQYLEAVDALLDTKREALEAEQELQRLTGLEFKAVQTLIPDKSSNP
ncbi:MAG: transporter [Verrucomicrobia bacterium]|nr:MAG: transporter [Verrucomicrobiota bacterium]